MRNRLLIICCLLAGYHLSAQPTCQGGLGDPIVDITFGQGNRPGFGPALASGITNLTYQDEDCPEDGFYAIGSHTSVCFGDTWFSLSQDHTGNANGYMMLINASYQPSVFYTQTVSGLCGGTSYQFAAWILNLDSKIPEILPNITFAIEKPDGTVLQSYTTGDIAQSTSPVWNQYAFYFNTPQGINSVVLVMTNNAPGGNGNDIALDDITFRPVGASVVNAVVGFPSDTLNFCINAQPTLTIDATVESCSASQSVQWQESVDAGNTWANIQGATVNSLTIGPTAAGVYLYRLSVAQPVNLGVTTCEVESPPVEVNVIAIPNPAISIALATDTNCVGVPVTINTTTTDAGATPFYQFFVNGALISSITGTPSESFTSSSLNNGDVVSVQMQSDAACLLHPNGIAVSNLLTIPMIPTPVTGVSVAASVTQICADSVVKFVATPVNGGETPTYQWLVNGAEKGGDSAVFDDAGLRNGDVVNVVMTADLACSQPVEDPQGVTMTIFPLPVIDLDSAIVIAGGSSVQLTPQVSGDLAGFAWTPTLGMIDPNDLTPVVQPVSSTGYTLSVVTMDGCKASATELVDVFYDVKLPAAFTPNGDGHNDVFRVPPGIPVTIRRFAVYNRQGMMLFYTTNVASGWDGTYNGKPQPAGTYAWFVEYDNPLTKTVGEKQGTVILVR